jgi:hypothetical protein
MNKELRFEMIRTTYQKIHGKRKKRTPGSWSATSVVGQKKPPPETGTILEFCQEDIREEIHLMGSLRRSAGGEGEFDIESLFE